MRVSCIIPAYDEATTVADVVAAALACAAVDEVIVACDGCTDETARRAREAGADRVLVLTDNLGKGRAVLAAAVHAEGDVLLLVDADLQGLRPAHLSKLLAPVLAGEADMTIALFAEDPLHLVLHQFSGQRALHRGLLRAPEVRAATGFGLEMALDRAAARHGAAVVRVPLRGLSHRRKRDKYGTMKGLRLQFRASADLVRTVRDTTDGQHLPPTPAGRRRPPAALGALPSLHPGDRLLVVVAHPDDEVIGAGGLIATARRAGVPVHIVVLTNGDSNRVSAAIAGRHLRPQPADFRSTGMRRQQEALDALARLGVDPPQVSFLGFPDRTLARVLASPRAVRSSFTRLDRASYPDVIAPDAPYTGSALRTLAEEIVRGVRPTVIVTHAPFDRHGDHRAAHRLMQEVRPPDALFYVFLVHAAGFPRPLRSVPRRPLLPPRHVPMDGWSWLRLDLSPEAHLRKRRALGAHRSQIETPYLRFLLGSFIRTNELFAERPS